MELVTYIDFNSPNAWLALNPTRQLAREVGIGVDWRPFSRKPRPRLGIDPLSKGARHAQVRAEYRRREEAFYAEQQRIPLVYPDREREAFAANAGLAWLRSLRGTGVSRCDTYVKMIFDQVWSGAMDPRDPVAVREAVASAGCETEGFDGWLDEHAEGELEKHRGQALEWGVVDVPGYVADGEPFVGRANLPVIRWLLNGP